MKLSQRELDYLVNQVVAVMDLRQKEAAKTLTESIKKYQVGDDEPKDYRASNLRESHADHYKHVSRGKVDEVGVSWNIRDQRYYVSFRSKYLGMRESLAEAVALRKDAEAAWDASQ